MGIADIRNAFMDAGQGQLNCTTCEMHTIQDGKNSLRLIISGIHSSGTPFSLDSGPFDGRMPPADKARAMAAEVLKDPPGFRQPPRQAAASR